MSGASFIPQTLVQSDSSTSNFTNFSTVQRIINDTDVYTIPANILQPGSKFRTTIWGAISNVITAQPTFTFSIRFGTTAVWSSGAIATNTAAHTLSPFELVVNWRVDTKGSSTAATVKGLGKLSGIVWTLAAGSDPTVTHTSILVPIGAPVAGTGFDSTSAQAVDVACAISAANASTGVRVDDYLLEWLAD